MWTGAAVSHRYRCTGPQSGEAWPYLPGRARPVAPVLAVRPPGGASQGSHLHRGGPRGNGMSARPGQEAQHDQQALATGNDHMDA